MGVDDYLRLGQYGVQTAIFVCAPILVLGLVAGFAVSVFQAATQINDAALAFIPKIAATIIGLVIFGNFMINRIAAFAAWAFSQIASLGP